MSQYRPTYFSESACSIFEWAAFSVDAPDSSASYGVTCGVTVVLDMKF